MNPKAKRDMLKFDALGEAEKATGHSYKEDEPTMGLGFMLHIGHTATKQAMLESQDDTSMRTKIEDYIRIAKSIGFEMVLEHDIIIPKELKQEYDDEKKVNRHYIMWHPGYAILLTFDSYWGNKSINGSKFYYSWRPEKDLNTYDYTSSGSMVQGPLGEDDRIWIGSHDGREALRFNISELAAHGEFVKQWPKYPSLWLMHYGDQRLPKELEDNHSAVFGRGGHWDQVNCGYAAQLPEHIQKAICFNRG